MKILTIPAYDGLSESTQQAIEKVLLWIDETYKHLWQLESDNRIIFEDAIYKYVFAFQYTLDERIIGSVVMQNLFSRKILTPIGFIIKGDECQLSLVELPPYFK